jgi:hypothetical protein
MNFFVVLLQDRIDENSMKETIAKLFHTDALSVRDIFSVEKGEVFYQINSLGKDEIFDSNQDNLSYAFCYEFSIYPHIESKIQYKNSLEFAIDFVKISVSPVLISAFSKNPYQWLLVHSDGIYLVEEKDNTMNDACLSIDITSRKRLLLERVKDLWLANNATSNTTAFNSTNWWWDLIE